MPSICMVRWCKGGGKVGSRESGDGSVQGENRCWMLDVGCRMLEFVGQYPFLKNLTTIEPNLKRALSSVFRLPTPNLFKNK